MKTVQINVPKINDIYKMYIYRSKHSEDINTIAKVRTIKPIAVIDSATAFAKNGWFTFYDKPGITTGITYIGPQPNTIPVTEYAADIKAIPVNKYTFVNGVTIEPLPVDYNGTMLYYSCIGVNEAAGLITHLSKVTGVLVDTPYQEGTRHLYSCDNCENIGTDVWNYVCSVPWDQEIKLGNVLDPVELSKYGCPVVEKIPVFRPEDVKVSTRPVATSSFGVLEIPNPWFRNNRIYNYRRLKAFRVCNVYNEQYSEYSEPTYQSQVPVSIEKMIIMRRDDFEGTVSLDAAGDDVTQYMIIRRDGIYYKPKYHKQFGLNKYNIPLEEDFAVFNEASTQETIKKQVKMSPAHVYSFSVYLIDVYEHVSEPVNFIVRT